MKDIYTNKTSKTVVRIITRLNVGGPAKHTVYLTHFLNKEKFKTHLISGKVENNEREMLDIIKNYSVKPIYIHNLKRTLNPLHDLITIFKLLRIICSIKPDIIHTHTAKAGTTGRLAAGIYNLIRFATFKKTAKIFHTFHGHTFYGYHNKYMNKLFIIIERLICKLFTDKIIVLNTNQYNDIVNKFLIASPDKAQIIPLGFNFKEIIISEKNKEHFIKKYNISNKTFVIGIVGRLTAIKNHIRFIKIALLFLIKYPNYNIKFCVIGEGELKSELQTFAEKNNISDYIVWTGNINDPSIIYSGIDLLALTSDNEGTPLSILEAFYSKIPVISTGVGGVPDLLKDNKGIIVEKEDLQTFAEKIKFIMDNKEFVNQMTANAYNYVTKNHSIDNLVNNISNLYI